MIVGTNHFVSMAAALVYYRGQGCDAADVRRKVAAGEVAIGKPPLKPGERLLLVDDGRRYAIETTDGQV